MKRTRLMILCLLITGDLAMSQSNVEPSHRFVWCENIGWTNWRGAGKGANGVQVGLRFLAGFVWSENAGWIHAGDGTPQTLCAGQPCYANVDSNDYGVNVDGDGSLHGLAWGENIGWINFDTALLDENRAHFDACERLFSGFAWGENIGWINLGGTTTLLGIGPCGFADMDCDGNVASDDYAIFSLLLGGPDASVGCPAFDSDEDGDIDLLDFAAFQVVFAE